jgi:GntR family transcriptional regulator, transcriptional repressor for pyruvate dehydrogenase complex
VAVTDLAIEKLKGMIASGELQPGQRLPREADLAANLGLSRSSLREAVRVLSVLRILDVRQGDGTYVSSLSTESLVDALTFIAEFHQDSSVLQLLEVRRILEPAASARAARLATADEIAGLRAILDQATPASSVEDLVSADIEFHRAIASAARNPVLASLIESLSGRTQRARLWRGITEEGALARTLAEHRSIFDAIAAHDPELAESWATVHVSGVETWLHRTLD